MDQIMITIHLLSSIFFSFNVFYYFRIDLELLTVVDCVACAGNVTEEGYRR